MTILYEYNTLNCSPQIWPTIGKVSCLVLLHWFCRPIAANAPKQCYCLTLLVNLSTHTPFLINSTSRDVPRIGFSFLSIPLFVPYSSLPTVFHWMFALSKQTQSSPSSRNLHFCLFVYITPCVQCELWTIIKQKIFFYTRSWIRQRLFCLFCLWSPSQKQCCF